VRSVVPDVPLYAPHYTATPDKAKTRSPQRSTKDGFKVLDTSLTASSFEDGPITVPDLIGQPLLKATDAIDRLGLVSVSGGSGKVIAQYPPAGAHVRSGTHIQLTLSPR